MKETSGASLGSPSGITLDGNYVWVVDKTKDKAYKYLLSSLFSGSGSLNATAQFSLNAQNGNATGIAVGNNSNLLRTTESQLTLDDGLLIYPNPTTGKTNFKFSLANSEKYNLIIMDMASRIIVNQINEGVKGINAFEIDLTNKPKGIYMVRLESNSLQVHKKIILD
jgi:hypothetical protein